MPEQFSKETLELLSKSISSGIINLDDVKSDIMKKENEMILQNHPYKIYKSGGRWCCYLQDGNNERRLIARKRREDVEKTIIEHYKSQKKFEEQKLLTLEKFYQNWIDYKKTRVAETTIMRYQTDWKKYYVDTDIYFMPLVNITGEYLEEWCHNLIVDNNMTKTNYYNVTGIIRQILKYAVKKHIITKNPFLDVDTDELGDFQLVKKKPSETQVYTKEEQKEVSIMAWFDFENRIKTTYELAPLAYLFLFETGLRCSEVCSIKFSDLERPKYAHIQRMYQRDTDKVLEHTKTENGDREVYLTSGAMEIINKAKERQESLGVYNNDAYIFSINEKPLIHRAVTTLCEKYCRRLGIPTKSPHKIRKSYISTLIDSHSVSLATVSQQAGHKSERYTLGHYYFDRNSISKIEQGIEQALA